MGNIFCCDDREARDQIESKSDMRVISVLPEYVECHTPIQVFGEIQMLESGYSSEEIFAKPSYF